MEPRTQYAQTACVTRRCRVAKLHPDSYPSTPLPTHIRGEDRPESTEL